MNERYLVCNIGARGIVFFDFCDSLDEVDENE